MAGGWARERSGKAQYLEGRGITAAEPNDHRERARYLGVRGIMPVGACVSGGADKVARLLAQFFKSDLNAKWYVRDGPAPRARAGGA